MLKLNNPCRIQRSHLCLSPDQAKHLVTAIMTIQVEEPDSPRSVSGQAHTPQEANPTEEVGPVQEVTDAQEVNSKQEVKEVHGKATGGRGAGRKKKRQSESEEVERKIEGECCCIIYLLSSMTFINFIKATMSLDSFHHFQYISVFPLYSWTSMTLFDYFLVTGVKKQNFSLLLL